MSGSIDVDSLLVLATLLHATPHPGSCSRPSVFTDRGALLFSYAPGPAPPSRDEGSILASRTPGTERSSIHTWRARQPM